MKKNYDFKILVLCNTKNRILEEDFKGNIEASRDEANEGSNCKGSFDFITEKEISKNILYQKIITKINDNKRKKKFNIKINYDDTLLLRDYIGIVCLHSDEKNLIRVDIRKDYKNLGNLHLECKTLFRANCKLYMNYLKEYKNCF